MPTSRTPSPSSNCSEGNKTCVMTFYDNLDSEVESHFMRALQRAAERSESGDEERPEGASPTPSDRCSIETVRESPLQCYSQAVPSPTAAHSNSVASLPQSVTEETPRTTSGIEAIAPQSYLVEGGQTLLYPPPPYVHHFHGSMPPAHHYLMSPPSAHPYLMTPPPKLLQTKLLQPHILQQLVQPDEYAMDQAELPTVPGQGRTRDFPWPYWGGKGATPRTEGSGSIYSSPHCNLIGQHAMMSSQGTVHHPPAHSTALAIPTSRTTNNIYPATVPPPNSWHPHTHPLQGMYPTHTATSQLLQAL